MKWEDDNQGSVSPVLGMHDLGGQRCSGNMSIKEQFPGDLVHDNGDDEKWLEYFNQKIVS